MPEAKPIDLKKHFAKFVSSVEGHLVTRYGTFPRSNIGADRTIADDGTVTLTWDTKRVNPISNAEYARYKREYDTALAEKALTERSAEDYVAFMAAEESEEKARVALLEKKAKTATPTPAPTPTPS